MTNEHPGDWTVSIRQPWASALAAGADRRYELATWSPPGWAIGRRIALHASALEADGRWLMYLASAMRCDPEELKQPLGAVVGIALLTVSEPRIGKAFLDKREPHRREDIRAVWRWEFEFPLKLGEPVSCPGHPGLWKLPSDVAARVYAQIPTGSPLR